MLTIIPNQTQSLISQLSYIIANYTIMKVEVIIRSLFIILPLHIETSRKRVVSVAHSLWDMNSVLE